MTITAQLADGRQLEFPDGTDPKVIQGTVKKVIGSPSSAHPVTEETGSMLERGGQLLARGGADLAGLPVGTAETLSNLATKMVPGVKQKPVSNFPMSPEWLKSKLPSWLVGKEPHGVLEHATEMAPSFAVPTSLASRTAKVVDPVLKRLAGEGVVTTPGQRAAASGTSLGKMGGAIEEKLAALLPPVKNARAKAVEQWNTARLNDALKDAGAKEVPKGLTGRDAIRHTYQQLQDRYSEVLGKIKVDYNKDQGFKDALKNARGRFSNTRDPAQDAGGKLDREQSATLKDIIDNQVINKFSRTGEIDGKNLKEIEETLRVEAERHENGSYQERQLSQVLYDLRSEFKAMVTRQNPEAGKELQAIDQGYAKYKTSARASNYSATKAGNYTTGQRLQSVKARDTSKDKNAFSTGQAGGQKEAEEAQKYLGNTEPDSGTPFGNAILATLLGVGGHAVSPGYGAALAASPLAYSQPVMKALQSLALRGTSPVDVLGAQAAVPLLSGDQNQPPDFSAAMRELGVIQ